MNTKQPLKFPAGEFTHTMLAEHNGATNQQVWTRYQDAIKDKTIIFIGERQVSGKGKPSKWWKLNDGSQASAPVEKTEVKPKPVVAKIKTIPTVKVTPPVVKPKTTTKPIEEIRPVVQALHTTEEPEVVQREEPLPVAPGVNPFAMTSGPEKSNFKCPRCTHDLITWTTARGVFVQCNQPFDVCNISENAEGFGRNEKSAYTILCQKFGHE